MNFYIVTQTVENMSKVIRFGVSLEEALLDQFDRLIKERKYTNRSEAIRDLIRQELLKKEWTEDQDVAGAIIYIYDHHQRDLLNKIIDVQHGFQEVIKSTQHIHLDHHNCLEIVAVMGNAAIIRQLANTLKALKGVRHGSLSMSGTGQMT
jgi:CopG family transcriptional regulator, nickel-responsive regulator